MELFTLHSQACTIYAMKKTYDEVIIGAGIIGIMYAFLLKHAKPDTSILVIEKFNGPATESSNAWNNAGTWHGANCEVNYTPEKGDTVDISKALNIHEQAVKTLELLSYITEKGILDNPKKVINKTSHMSLVFGEDDRKFLYKRFKEMSNHHFFSRMKITENISDITEWASPLLTSNRSLEDVVTATSIPNGAGINYGQYTKTLFDYLESETDVDFMFETSPQKIKRNEPGYTLTINNEQVETKKLLLAAGGGTLPLMQKIKSPSANQYAGFPVGGKFLVCKNTKVTEQIQAKVYGKASVGAPPMSVPHFDTRFIDGTRYILFGPQATFNPRFLKKGSLFDLIASVRPNNLLPMISVAFQEFGLVKYLVGETLSGKGKLFEQLKTFYPDAKLEDWDLVTAGQRVQIIKRASAVKGDLKLGTELVIDDQGNLGALLGASPGATVAPAIMLQMLEKLHPGEINEDWINRLKEIIPSYKESLAENKELYLSTRERVDKTLGLN